MRRSGFDRKSQVFTLNEALFMRRPKVLDTMAFKNALRCTSLFSTVTKGNHMNVDLPMCGNMLQKRAIERREVSLLGYAE